MRLKVNDIVLDQFRNTIIAQTYETTNFGDISTRRGGFSNDFTLPLTSKNEEALGYPSDLNIDNRNPYQKVDAQLIDDGAVISIGYLRYKIVSDNTIQCSFFSDNTEWFNLIKDKNLIDLDLSSLDHTWDYTNIETAINAEGSLGYTYPIIDYGEFLSHDTNEVDDTSLFPAIYFSTVLSQIYSDIGWSVTGELLTDERFIRQVVPFCKKSFSHTEQWVNDRYQDISILISAPAPPPITLSPTINITDDGSYRLNVNLNIVMIGIVSSFLTIQYKKNGVIYDTYDTNIDQNTPTRYNNTSSIEVFNNGDVASISILTDAGSQVNIASDSFAYLLPEREIVNSGDTIEMSNILPDISQSDFLKYVFFSYGVIPQSDSYSKTVRLDFFNSIEDNVSNALDWSEKLDVSKSISTDFTQLLNNYSKDSILTYEDDDNDNELVSYKSETEKNLGQGSINIDNEHLNPKKEVYTSPFTSMINIVSFNNKLYVPQIRFLEFNDDSMTWERSINVSPKTGLITDNLSVTDLSSGNYNSIVINERGGAGSATLANIPFCWFVKTPYIPEVDSYSYNLSYGDVEFPNVTDNNLKEDYIQDFEDVLNNMKYLKAYFKIDETDMVNLDFLIPVYIDRFKSYFYINKVNNYQGANKTTEVELIKLG